MAKKTSYAVAMGRERPDFVGKMVAAENGFLVLENPMVVEYLRDRTVVFNTDFMPAGMAPKYDRSPRVHIPVERLQYYITLDEDDDMVKAYLEEVSLTPEKAAAG